VHDVLLGIDVGTSSVKAAFVTPGGRAISSREVTYPTHHPSSGWAEQDPRDWWNAACRAVRACLEAGEIDTERVGGIGVSGQGCAVTLLDVRGEVVRPAIIGMDSRSEVQAEQLRRESGAEIERRGGKTPAPYNADPVLMWLAQHEPGHLRRAQTSLTTTGYMLHRLTGEAVMNASDASILFAYDLGEGGWAPDLIARFGLPRRLYPRLTEGHEVVGPLTLPAAADLGLHPGVPVVGGGEDTSSAALAAGATRSGQAVLSLGTAGTVYLVRDEPQVVPRLLTFRHVLPGRWLLGGSTVAMGAALEWARQALTPDLGGVEAFTALAAQAPPGADGLVFLPYLSGELQPINDGHARGAFVGLDLRHERRHLARAVMEGAAYALAHNLALTGASVGSLDLRATGGPTRSPLWCQTIADVTGQQVSVVANGVGAPLGNALLAAQGAGLIDDPAAVAEANVRVSRTYAPRPAEHATYAPLLHAYQALYPCLRDVYSVLAGARHREFA